MVLIDQMDREDDNVSRRILIIEEELAKQLNIPERVFKVEWLEPEKGVPGVAPFIPSDQCYIESDSIFLPLVLKERLAPEEIRPLLASRLVYNKKLSIAIGIAKLMSLTVLVLIESALIFVFSRLGLGGLLLMFPICLGIGFPILMLLPLIERRGQLSADKSAAVRIGREDFLRTLERIDSFGFPDIEKLKSSHWARLRSDVPSITQRINVVRALRT